MTMELIEKYFPNLTATQREQFAQLGPLYDDWNANRCSWCYETNSNFI